MAEIKIIVALDSFKGSLDAIAACRAVASGLKAADDALEIIEHPMADGGEGSMAALTANWGTVPIEVDTVDALRRPCRASYGLSADGRRAVIELASASGLPAVADALNPLIADTYGTGLLIVHALDAGVSEIILCLGGSASVDAGSGILRALGVQFRDETGAQLRPGGASLKRLAVIDLVRLHPGAAAVRWKLAVDVENPLLGVSGAAAVYGPQKGASPDDVRLLDAALTKFADVVEHQTGRDVRDQPGYGAAGGIAAGLSGFFDIQLWPGAALIAKTTSLVVDIGQASLVITGEGRCDAQSIQGKVVGTIAKLVAATNPRCPVLVLAGEVVLNTAMLRQHGLAAAFSIADGPATLNEMMSRTEELLRRQAEMIGCLFVALSKGDPAASDA